MLQRVRDTHRYNTRSTESDIAVTGRDQGSISFRVSKEWATVTEAGKEIKSLTTFRKISKNMFITLYEKFQCQENECRVCGQVARVNQTS